MGNLWKLEGWCTSEPWQDRVIPKGPQIGSFIFITLMFFGLKLVSDFNCQCYWTCRIMIDTVRITLDQWPPRHKDTSHNTCEGRHPCCRHVGWLRWSAVARLRLLPRDQDAGHDAGRAGPDANDEHGGTCHGTCHDTCHGTHCGVLVPPDGHETHEAHVGARTAADAGAKLCLDGVSGSTAGAWMARATRTTTRSRWPRPSGFSAWTTHSSLCTHPDKWEKFGHCQSKLGHSRCGWRGHSRNLPVGGCSALKETCMLPLVYPLFIHV